MDTVLDVTGLNKSYDSFSLKDVSFSLPEGCITGFIGINGAPLFGPFLAWPVGLLEASVFSAWI